MKRGNDFLARLREHVLVGDGALGTVFSERADLRDGPCERLNRTRPDLVRGVHAEYVDAGSRLVETNTFGANRTKLAGPDAARDVADLNALGVRLAREAAGERAFVAGSVGPLAAPSHSDGPLTDDQAREVFREQVVVLADAGADLLMLETFTDLPQLLLALSVAKQHTDLPVVCQLAFHERGHTPRGVAATTALEALTKAGADVVGANCGRGVRAVALAAVQMARADANVLVSAYPNAGLPAYVDGRYLFGAPLPYLVRSAGEMADAGVNLIGGCCGTTPAYVRAVAEALAGRAVAVRVTVAPPAAPTVPAEPAAAPAGPPPGSILDKLAEPEGRPLIVVELDPPHGLEYAHVVRRARQLRDMGVDAITMADNPVARLHMGNLALARIVQDEAEVPVVMHMTCRDHNLLGLQSRLMEAYVSGVHHVLALTGDGAKHSDVAGTHDVYDTNSIGLIGLLATFNTGFTSFGKPLGRPTRFAIGCAFNPTGASPRHLAHHVAKLRKKVAAGAHFALTQPVFDPARYQLMREATADLGIPILVGIMPLLSERNAEYLHNEVPDIYLTDDVRRRMRGLTGPAGRRAGLEICKELIGTMADTADGFYLIPPQSRTELAVELVEFIHARRPAGRPLSA